MRHLNQCGGYGCIGNLVLDLTHFRKSYATTAMASAAGSAASANVRLALADALYAGPVARMMRVTLPVRYAAAAHPAPAPTSGGAAGARSAYAPFVRWRHNSALQNVGKRRAKCHRRLWPSPEPQ